VSNDLLSIGAFALLSGLSVTALRHYDDVGLLRPAFVDPSTGYRRYAPGQVRVGRLIGALRRVELPIEAVRTITADTNGDAARDALRRHRDDLAGRAHALSALVDIVDRYIDQGVPVSEPKTPRIVQVTINVSDLDATIAFYQAAFDAAFQEEIMSFQFGTWPSDEFFLLTVAHGRNDHGVHQGPTGASRFGLLVANVDATHQRALEAGAREIEEPYDAAWKPRGSSLLDPSGNRIDLSQG
jgi:DNA-binding transcriptional MerR regulator